MRTLCLIWFAFVVSAHPALAQPAPAPQGSSAASKPAVAAAAAAQPVAKPAGLPPIDFAKVTITPHELGKGVYMLQGVGGNIGLSIGPDGALLIDDQFAPLTPKVQAAVRKLGARSVRFVLNTHWHGDHTGGNENLGKAGAVIVAQHNARKRMSVEQLRDSGVTLPASPVKALPIVTFGEDASFYLNGDELQVFHTVPSHTDGDVLVRFVKANVVHMGDTFMTFSYPLVDRSSGGTYSGFIAVADRVLGMIDAETKIIPGHGVISNREGLQRWREMLVAIRERVAKLVAAGKTLDQVKAEQVTREWDEQYGKAFVTPDQVVTAVYKELKPGS